LGAGLAAAASSAAGAAAGAASSSGLLLLLLLSSLVLLLIFAALMLAGQIAQDRLKSTQQHLNALSACVRVASAPTLASQAIVAGLSTERGRQQGEHQDAPLGSKIQNLNTFIAATLAVKRA
jgi:hypothetical protein